MQFYTILPLKYNSKKWLSVRFARNRYYKNKRLSNKMVGGTRKRDGRSMNFPSLPTKKKKTFSRIFGQANDIQEDQRRKDISVSHSTLGAGTGSEMT